MKRLLLIFLVVWLSPLAHGQLALSKLERSYWLHASLASSPKKGYWGITFPASTKPASAEVQNAVRLLADKYAATRLYLIYHKEISVADAEETFWIWKKNCPAEVELVPTLVLRCYDKEKTEVFLPDELNRLAQFFKERINPSRIAIYDVYSGRDQGCGADILARTFPGGLVRLGLQPGEAIKSAFAAAVEDTWSGFCHGKTHEDWLQPGFGAQTLQRWVEERNTVTKPLAWDLIVVGWDYSVTKRGEYPGYDDAAKNMPLPAGRNMRAVREIVSIAKPESLAGFSSDLFILHVNSRHAAHDGVGGAFYDTLKRGEIYAGYYAEPFQEIVRVFRELKTGALTP